MQFLYMILIFGLSFVHFKFVSNIRLSLSTTELFSHTSPESTKTGRDNAFISIFNFRSHIKHVLELFPRATKHYPFIIAKTYHSSHLLPIRQAQSLLQKYLKFYICKYYVYRTFIIIYYL